MGEITGTLPCTLRRAQRWRAGAHMIGIRRKNHTRGFPFLWPRAAPFVPWGRRLCRVVPVDHFRRAGLCRSYPNVSSGEGNGKRYRMDTKSTSPRADPPLLPRGMEDTDTMYNCKMKMPFR